MLQITDIVYQGGGMIITFDDGSVATAVPVVNIQGNLTYAGLTQEQLAAWLDFGENNVDESFQLVKGATGAQGPIGPTGPAGGTPAAANTVTVGPTDDYDYIDLQSAMIGASDGDTILVYEGADLVFTQNIILDRDLTIIAEPSLDLRQEQTTLLEITAPTVTDHLFYGETTGKKTYFKGFKFSYNSSSGDFFFLLDGDLVLDHCLLESTSLGAKFISLIFGRLDFLESVIDAKGAVGDDGISLRATSSGLIRNSKITVNSTGIEFTSSGTLDIIDTEVYGYTPLNVSDGIVNLNGVLLTDSSGSYFSVFNEGGIINFFGCSLYSQNICIFQSSGVINWDQSSSCSGNDNPNSLSGGTLNRRTPQNLWETAALEDVTGQVFESVEDALNTKGKYPCKRLGAGTEYDSIGYMSGIATWDYASIEAIELLVIPEVNNATFDYDVAVHYSADGEAYNAHSAATSSPNFNAVLDQKQAIDISALFTSLAAGDSFGIEFTNQEGTDQINILGVRFRWKKA